MIELTKKEEEIMTFFWEKGPLYVKDIQAFYDDPKPHVNTISTIVRILEDKGMVGHESISKTYRYYALVDKNEFSKNTLKGIVRKYFNNSSFVAISSLIQEEDISLDELRKLIDKGFEDSRIRKFSYSVIQLLSYSIIDSMGIFFAYNLKLTFCFVLFYIMYKTVLSGNTFYDINRRVLMLAYPVIVLIPFIDVSFFELPVRQSADIYLFISNYEQFFVSPTPVQLKWTDLIVSVYLAGMLFSVIRYFYYTAKIIRILIQGEKVGHCSGEKIIITNQRVAPFSWMRYIVIYRADYTENGAAIIAHEAAHIARGHYLDLFIAEIFTVIQWYNPFIWLTKNELKELHEFEADHVVLDSGFNPKQYQLLLIKKAVGSQRFNSMTNSLNHSKLNKRITMMLKEKSSHWAKMKYLTVLPLIAFALAVFARPEISGNLDKISEVKVSELSSKIETEIGNLTLPKLSTNPTVSTEHPQVITKDSLSAEEEKKLRLHFEGVQKHLDEVKKQIESGEWQKHLEELQKRFESTEGQKQLKALEEKFASEEWQNKMKNFEFSAEAQEKVQKQMEELQKRFESAEWKEKFEKMQKEFDSAEWQEKMKNFELSAEAQEKLQKQMEELQKRFESAEWKEKFEKMQKEFDSAEWQEKMKNFKFSPEAIDQLQKLYGSEWEKQMEELQKRFESDEWKQQMKELKEKFESEDRSSQFQLDLSPDIRFNFDRDTLVTEQ